MSTPTRYDNVLITGTVRLIDGSLAFVTIEDGDTELVVEPVRTEAVEKLPLLDFPMPSPQGREDTPYDRGFADGKKRGIAEALWKAADNLPVPTNLASAHRERDAWADTAAFHARNEDYYRGLVDQIAAHVGPEVYVQDDGGVVDEPLRAKVPELVKKMARRLAAAEALAKAAERVLDVEFGVPSTSGEDLMDAMSLQEALAAYRSTP